MDVFYNGQCNRVNLLWVQLFSPLSLSCSFSQLAAMLGIPEYVCIFLKSWRGLGQVKRMEKIIIIIILLLYKNITGYFFFMRMGKMQEKSGRRRPSYQATFQLPCCWLWHRLQLCNLRVFCSLFIFFRFFYPLTHSFSSVEVCLEGAFERRSWSLVCCFLTCISVCSFVERILPTWYVLSLLWMQWTI